MRRILPERWRRKAKADTTRQKCGGHGKRREQEPQEQLLAASVTSPLVDDSSSAGVGPVSNGAADDRLLPLGLCTPQSNYPCDGRMAASGKASFGRVPRNSGSSRMDSDTPQDPPDLQGKRETLSDIPLELPCVPPQLTQPVQPVQMAFCLAGDALDLMVAPGDVLNVKSSGRLSEIGTAHGFLGHVLLVLSAPINIRKDSDEGRLLQAVWPPGDVDDIWKVRTLESTRSERGLHEADLLMYVDECNGQIILVGERRIDGTLVLVEPEQVELWQSPRELRSHLRIDLMQNVLTEMKANEASWSHITAARAVLSSALIGRCDDPQRTMEMLRGCWTREPICTSVVIVFWQRYLCELVAAQLGATTGGSLPPLDFRQQVDLILRWMPLKADRGLPGDLLGAMRTTGWVTVAQVPRIFRPMVLGCPPANSHTEEFARQASSRRAPGSVGKIAKGGA